MARITSRGKVWELRNSLWMLWTILTFGGLNYISFFYAAYKVKQRKWFIAGMIYALISIGWIVIFDKQDEKGFGLYDILTSVYFLGSIVSIFHVFKIRTEYLLRLEAKLAFNQKEKEMESLKHKIAMEYGTIGPKMAATKEQVPPVHEIVKEESKRMNIIDINTATEKEIAEVPGVGSLFAKKVVVIRDQENGFKSFDHFIEVLSVKPHLVERIRPYLSFSETATQEHPRKTEGRIVDF